MWKTDLKKQWCINIFIIIISIIGILMVASLSGCMTEKRINKFKNIYCKDSISVVIKERVVKIPVYYADSSMLEVWLQCDSIGNIYYSNWKQIEGKYIQVKAKLDSNIFKVKTILNIKDSIRYIARDTNKYNATKITTNILTDSQKKKIAFANGCIIAGFVLLGLLILATIIFIYRKKLQTFLQSLKL